MNILVVGYGAIGRERVNALEMLNQTIVGIVDPDKSKWFGAYRWFEDLTGALKTIISPVHWVFICTPHHQTAELVKIVLASGCNVLAEKPVGRELSEVPAGIYNVGFNYRFFKGISQLLIDCQNNLFGDLISVNMVLGLGDPPGSELTWRLDPLVSGRGASLDPGIHLVDLAILISKGDLMPEHFKYWLGFFNTGVEEESHIIATDSNGAIYNLQSSIVRWRNTFRIEVNGSEGYGIVEGRNRNYGSQTYRRGVRWGWKSGKPQRETEEEIVNYNGEDSFLQETRAVLFGANGIQPATNEDNYKCLQFIDSL